MFKRIISLLVICFSLFQISCNNDRETLVEKKVNQKPEKNFTTKFSGEFFGMIPCADCPGIEATIHFKPDSIFIENLKYLERNISFTDTGKWSISGKIITVYFPGHQSYFNIKSDSSISMLDSEKKEIKCPLSDKYILKRKK